MCDAIADITDDFSFAYLKEAFVATLLELARNSEDDEISFGDDDDDDDDDPFDKYEFWRAFKEQVKILRSEMGDSTDVGSDLPGTPRASSEQHSEIVALLDAIRLQGSSEPGKAGMSLARGAPGSRARFVQNGSVFEDSPIIRDFSPLAETKNSKLNEGVWEWGV
jgi:transitional endoplasmic reticulum ATPase